MRRRGLRCARTPTRTPRPNVDAFRPPELPTAAALRGCGSVVAGAAPTAAHRCSWSRRLANLSKRMASSALAAPIRRSRFGRPRIIGRGPMCDKVTTGLPPIEPSNGPCPLSARAPKPEAWVAGLARYRANKKNFNLTPVFLRLGREALLRCCPWSPSADGWPAHVRCQTTFTYRWCSAKDVSLPQTLSLSLYQKACVI